MRQRARTKNQLRCPACRGHPLLAVYGVDERGRVYLHVKVYKQDRIYGEIIAFGDISLKCRECNRWHHLHIDNKEVKIQQADPPEAVKSN